MLSPVSVDFINFPIEEIDRGIIEALGNSAIKSGADKASLFLFSEDLNTVINSYEWYDGEEINKISLPPNSSTEVFSPSFAKWKNFEKTLISSQPESKEKDLSEKKWPGPDFTSLVFIPVVLRGHLYGALGFYKKSEKKWPDEVIELLEFMSSLIISALERKKTEENLRKSNERYRDVVELQSELICHFLPDSTITFANKAMCSILNLGKEEITGKRIFDFESREYKEQLLWNLKDITPENPVVSHEQNLLTSSGLSLWIQWVNRGIFDENGNVLEYQGVGRDITERKKAEGELKKIEWMLGKAAVLRPEKSPYGDLSELNVNGLILNSVGKEMLQDIVSDYMILLETSSAVYEKDGSYALGIFSSGWCKFLDCKSRELCHNMDNREALLSGKWLCHESCWSDASSIAIEKGEPVDIECNGGIRLYAVPVLAGQEIVGAINFGYGDPPSDRNKLKEIAEKYHVTAEELIKEGKKYESRPPFIIELAKKKILSSARLIGEIVQRKRTEEALRESERKYKNLYNYASVGLFETSLKEGKILACNRLYCHMAGFSSVEEALNQDVLQFYVIPDQREEIKKLLLEKGYVENYVAQLKSLTGRKFWAEFSARVNQERSVIEGTIIDITDRKKAEDAIAAEKERLSVTLRSIGDGVIATDISGHILIMNSVAEKLTGWSLEEAYGRELSTVFHIINEMTGELCENPVQKVLRTGDIVELENHTILLSRDGRNITISDSGAPIKDKYSNTSGVVLVFRDITEKKKIMEHLQKTQKLDSLGLLAGGIAHDFNNLLGGLFGYIELANDMCEDKEVSLYLSNAFRVYDRARALTQQLLTFSKGGSPLKKTDKLTSFIKDSVNFILAGSSIKCIFNIDDRLWPCDFDSSQIGQVIDNIVINALQAMPCGGELHIGAENIHSLPPIHGPSGKGKYVKVSIEDQGVGIKKEFLKNIFDPFFTTKQKGSGLGLSIVYSIIKKHDGFIDVESEQGKGTVFNIYLPASEGNITYSNSVKHEEYTGKGSVLVMDDDEDIKEILNRILKKMGHSTVSRGNSKDTISAFIEAEKKVPFPIVFLDMTIPGDMGGKEVIKHLLSIRPSLKAVAISGYSEDPVMADPKKFGFAASLKKPFLKDEIAALLKDLGL